MWTLGGKRQKVGNNRTARIERCVTEAGTSARAWTHSEIAAGFLARGRIPRPATLNGHLSAANQAARSRPQRFLHLHCRSLPEPGCGARGRREGRPEFPWPHRSPQDHQSKSRGAGPTVKCDRRAILRRLPARRRKWMEGH